MNATISIFVFTVKICEQHTQSSCTTYKIQIANRLIIAPCRLFVRNVSSGSTEFNGLRLETYEESLELSTHYGLQPRFLTPPQKDFPFTHSSVGYYPEAPQWPHSWLLQDELVFRHKSRKVHDPCSLQLASILGELFLFWPDQCFSTFAGTRFLTCQISLDLHYTDWIPVAANSPQVPLGGSQALHDCPITPGVMLSLEHLVPWPLTNPNAGTVHSSLHLFWKIHRRTSFCGKQNLRNGFNIYINQTWLFLPFSFQIISQYSWFRVGSCCSKRKDMKLLISQEIFFSFAKVHHKASVSPPIPKWAKCTHCWLMKISEGASFWRKLGQQKWSPGPLSRGPEPRCVWGEGGFGVGITRPTATQHCHSLEFSPSLFLLMLFSFIIIANKMYFTSPAHNQNMPSFTVNLNPRLT